MKYLIVICSTIVILGFMALEAAFVFTGHSDAAGAVAFALLILVFPTLLVVIAIAAAKLTD